MNDEREPEGARDAGADAPGPEPGSAGPGGPAPGAGDMDQLKNILLFLPRLAALVGRLLIDAGVSATDKALLGALVLYLASPLDIVPDFIPVVGQVDDIYLVALVLLRFLNRSGEAKLRQHWDGPEDIVGILGKVTDLATRYLPEPVRRALRGWIDLRTEGTPPQGA